MKEDEYTGTLRDFFIFTNEHKENTEAIYDRLEELLICNSFERWQVKQLFCAAKA